MPPSSSLTPSLADIDQWLAQRRLDLATDLALESASPSLCQHLLERAGWEILFSTLRPQLPRLLDACVVPARVIEESLYGLHLAWTVEAQRLPHQAERALATRPLKNAGLQALLESRCAQMYDDSSAALTCAQAAVMAHASSLQALGLWASFALGFALLDAGRPQEAVGPLTLALKGANRDGLVILQIDALHVLARVHDEMANDSQTQACLEGAQAMAKQHGLMDLPALDSVRRLAALRALRMAYWGPVSNQSPAPATCPVPITSMPFPDLALVAQRALIEGRLEAAVEAIQVLRLREAQSYYPQKWCNELTYLEMTLAASLGQNMPPQVAESDGFLGLYALQRAVMRAGSALLAGSPGQATELEALAAELLERGLLRLHSRLSLVQALLQPSHEDQDTGVLAWMRSHALNSLDAQWLAPRMLTALEHLSCSPLWVGDALLRDQAQAMVQRLLGPSSTAQASSGDGLVRAPPLDLTAREWQVLRLIGQQWTNAQIANSLCLSLATIKTHINRVYAKLGIQRRIEAVQRARALVSIHESD